MGKLNMPTKTKVLEMAADLGNWHGNDVVMNRRRMLKLGLSAMAGSQLLARPSRGRASPKAALADNAFRGAGISYLQNGQIEMSESFGKTKAGGVPTTDQTLFQAASLSKTINALAVLRFVQDGWIDLDRPVNERIQSWRLPGRYADLVTPAMLLSHTGGINVPGFDGYLRESPIPNVIDVLNETELANSAPIVAELVPGAFRYSGGGTTVLQLLIEDITGEDYATVIQREVLEPLSMTHSTMQELDPTAAHIAWGHDGNARQIEGAYRIHPELAAAGLWTTPNDLCRACDSILRSLVGQPGAFLRPEIAARMCKPVSGPNGLGLFIFDDGVLSHAGFNAGYLSLFLADPRTGSAVAIMANSEVQPSTFEALFNLAWAPFSFRM